MSRHDLTERDWREIYYALSSKISSIENGHLTSDNLEEDAAWIAHLQLISKKIGVDGQDAYEKAQSPTPLPLKRSAVVELPPLDKESHEPLPKAKKTPVKIVQHSDSLEIQVEDGLKMFIEREQDLTRVFVIPSDGDDECAYITATDANGDDAPRVIIDSCGGSRVLDSWRRACNYGPPLWRDNRGGEHELHLLADTHLINILRMCMRIGRYFGGSLVKGYSRMLPAIYLSLEAEAERRKLSPSQWHNVDVSQADWPKGLDIHARARYGMCVRAFGGTLDDIQSALHDAHYQLANRVTESSMHARHEFKAFYDPDDKAGDAVETPHQIRDRVIVLTETGITPDNGS